MEDLEIHLCVPLQVSLSGMIDYEDTG